MAELVTAHTFAGTLDEVFRGISQYSEYPKYLPGVTSIEVLPPTLPESVARVRYELQIIKKFYYVLHMFAVPPGQIRWTLEESNIMKDNQGSWDLVPGEDGQSVHATYRLDVKFRGLVPSAVTDRVAAANLPAMMAGFQKLIDDTRRKSEKSQRKAKP